MAATIRRPVRMTGIGLHSRTRVRTVIKPAPAGSGIVFDAGLTAVAENASVQGRMMCLGRGGRRVRAVEHLLAACYGCGVTDLAVECPDGEPPFGDGSSRHFVRALARAGVVRHAGDPEPAELGQPVMVEGHGGVIAALPAERLRLSCMVRFPEGALESVSIRVTPSSFVRELAPARTVAVTTESPERLRRAYRLRFALVRRGPVVLPRRERFTGEFARHKTLDLLGDLSLLGRPLLADVFALRPSHRLNLLFVKELTEHLEAV